MSVTSVRPIFDLGTATDYLEFGVGDKKNQHKSAGTNRLAPGFYCDAPTVEEFLMLGNRLARRHRRRVKAQSYVLSFHPDEMDVHNDDDLRRVGDLGFLLAKKMHPHSPCMVVVHNDSVGGAAHAHITVLNHDWETGYALNGCRTHWQVQKVNDELMLEEGQWVTSKSSDPTPPWAERRAALEDFDLQLGDTIAEALADPSSTDMSTFLAACTALGVDVAIDTHMAVATSRRGKAGTPLVGMTYKTLDISTPGKKPRIRRRKASSLSSDFTYERVTTALAEKSKPITPISKALIQAQTAPLTAPDRSSVPVGIVPTSRPVPNVEPDPEEIAQLFGFVTNNDRARWANQTVSPRPSGVQPEPQPDPEPVEQPAGVPDVAPAKVLSPRVRRILAEHRGLDPDNQKEPSTQPPQQPQRQQDGPQR